MRNIYLMIVFLFFLYSVVAKADSNKKELRVTLQSSEISLDPGGIQDSQSLFVSRQVDCQLVRNQGSIFVLDAAESIKYLTPLKIIIKISDKSKFHDGSPITSEDVVASFNYIKEKRNIFKNFYIWVDNIHVKDNKEIVIILKKHIPQFLKVLSATNFNIFKKSFLEKAKMDKNIWKFPLGCGGYKVVEFNDQRIKLEPISSGLPIIFDLMKKNQLNAVEVGKYDIITLNVIGDSSNLYDFDTLEIFDPLQYYVGLNTKSKLWNNKSDRCRFLYELDVNNLLNSYGKVAIPANDLLPRGTLGYNAKSNYLFELGKLVKYSAYRKKDPSLNPFCLSYLTVSIQDNKKNYFLDMFKKNYSKIILKPINNVKRYGKTFINENCDALLFALKSNYFDGYEYLTIFENNDANFSGLYEEKLNSHILRSQMIEDSKDRAKEYQKISKEIRDLCFVRPLFTIATRRIYVRKTLKAPGIGLISIHQYYLGNISK